MTIIKITSIKRFDKDRDNKPLMTRDNRPYTRLILGAEGYDKTMSGFDSPATQNLKVGDEIEVEVETKGEYLNFKVPKKDNPNQKYFEDMNNKLVKILMGQAEILDWIRKRGGVSAPPQDNKVDGTDIDYPPDSDGEIPF